MSKTSEWQSWRCGVVLREVFAWLGGCELARAGAVCRAWRIAAAEPSLWRRLLLSEHLVEPAAHKYLCDHRTDSDTVSWRQEYVDACGGWGLVARHTPAGGATLLHAALAPSHDVLALGADDASLAVWRQIKGSWREVWRSELRPRGWAGVARVEWARHTPRLLLAGPRALIDDWELMVVHLDDDYGGGTIASRVRCSAGAAGCWADRDGDTFVSLELQLLAPGLACTAVRLNAATQETQSEYAGVTSSLLRIFNEDRAHITHVLVATLEEGRRVLVGGTAVRLATWPVAAPRPPPLLVGAPNELAERVRRHRARLAEPEQEPPVPDEETVRALCAPPDREWRLSAPLVGLVLDDSARWLWAACSDGSVTRVCVRSLEPRTCVRAPLCPPRPAAHYVQPGSTDLYVASPEGGYSPRVWIWSLRSGAAGQCGGEGPHRVKNKNENESYRNGNSVQRDISNRDSDQRDIGNRDSDQRDISNLNSDQTGISNRDSDQRGISNRDDDQRDISNRDDDERDISNRDGVRRDDVNGENDSEIDDEGGSYNISKDGANGSSFTNSEHATNAKYGHVGNNRDEGAIEHVSMDDVARSGHSGRNTENGRGINGASRHRGYDASASGSEANASGSGIDDADWREIKNAGSSRADDRHRGDDANGSEANASGSGIDDADWREIENAGSSRADDASGIDDSGWSEVQIASGSGIDDANSIETNTASVSAGQSGINGRNSVDGAIGRDSDSASRRAPDANGNEFKGVSGSWDGGRSGSGDGGRSGSVSGGGGGRGWRREQHSGAALCALLPRHEPDSLLVLAADTLYIWRRRATRQSSPSLFYD